MFVLYKHVHVSMNGIFVSPCYDSSHCMAYGSRVVDKTECKQRPLMCCRGKWARASADEVAAELAAGTPFCYRFRVPPNKDVVVRDIVRGDVRFNTSAVGDFVILRSNGLPVYNFCVAIDDALMKVTHVLRAEEHLPNTLRQVRYFLVPSCCLSPPHQPSTLRQS
jgi:glutamyl/glutaminyl-tRNA synthetase